MSRLAAIIYSTDNENFLRHAVAYARSSVSDQTTIIAVDNGSQPAFAPHGNKQVRFDENIGGNAIIHRMLEKTPEEILAFFHCDLFIHERNWDKRVLEAFDADPQLAMLGFVGSNEIDERGGRGGGTVLNYMGCQIGNLGTGSPAEAHGLRVNDLRAAAVLDHCSMIFRRSMLEQLTPQEGNYAPEHFYDRILSCEVIEKGWHVATLGIEVDHFSGGIGPGVIAADKLRRRWLEQEAIDWDQLDSYTAVYQESEKRFFRRFKDTGFFPFRVESDYTVRRW